MIKEDIRILSAIIHILDGSIGLPVLSEDVIDFGSDLADFLKEHIFKIMAGDDCKKCEFYQEQSEIFQMLQTYDDSQFVVMSQNVANLLYDIMNSNIDIPAADLAIVRFRHHQEEFLAILKMNYKSSYVHQTKTMEDEDGEISVNDVIKYKTILPSQTQRLQEAAIINLHTMEVHLVEKKYEVNGEKTNYFSYLFLKCSSKLSHKAKLSLVTKAVDAVQTDHYHELEQFEQKMKARSIIQEELLEAGSFTVEAIAEKIFEDVPECKIAFQEKMEKYDLVKEEIAPISESTIRKYHKQQIITDTGIEIKIPMEQYRDTKYVEFITNPDGTTSVVIKNISLITAKL